MINTGEEKYQERQSRIEEMVVELEQQSEMLAEARARCIFRWSWCGCLG